MLSVCVSEVRVGKKLAVYSLVFLIFKWVKKNPPNLPDIVDILNSH